MLNFFDSVSCETIIAENEAYEQVLAMVRLPKICTKIPVKIDKKASTRQDLSCWVEATFSDIDLLVLCLIRSAF